MNKLIKLSELHYIIVDDSEIKEGNKFIIECTLNTNFFSILTANKADEGLIEGRLKVTHSTEPLEEVVWWERETRKSKLGFDKIKPLSLLEVKEAINGYNVQEMAENNSKKAKSTDGIGGRYLGYIDGFKAHQELVKDKLFTTEDIGKAIDLYREFRLNVDKTLKANVDIFKKQVIQVLTLPKIEWEIIFDKQGKIKLI